MPFNISDTEDKKNAVLIKHALLSLIFIINTMKSDRIHDDTFEP